MRQGDVDEAAAAGAEGLRDQACRFEAGIPADDVHPYLTGRPWLIDAARLLALTSDSLAADLVRSMESRGAIVHRDGRLHAAADHGPTPPGTFAIPFPRDWA